MNTPRHVRPHECGDPLGLHHHPGDRLCSGMHSCARGIILTRRRGTRAETDDFGQVLYVSFVQLALVPLRSSTQSLCCEASKIEVAQRVRPSRDHVTEHGVVTRIPACSCRGVGLRYHCLSPWLHSLARRPVNGSGSANTRAG